MPVGISFGSATSGTGFDVTSTVNSILAIERTPETAWATQTTALQAQDTALSSLGTSVSSLSTALASLTSFDGVFASREGASSDSSIVALTSVGNTASTGSHSLSVQSLATTAQQHSSAIASSATLSGSLSLQLAGASSPTTIQIASGSTLAQVASQINASGAGVGATVLSDSSGQYLSLTSQTSGAAGSFTVSSSAQDSSGNAVSFTSSETGADAQYTLDGVQLTSSTNAVTSALQGVAFQLTGTTSTPVTVTIAADTSGIATALQSFVTAYNSLTSAMTTQEGNDSSGASEPLYGSPVLSTLQSQLSSAFAFQPTGSSAGLSFASLGLSLSQTGTLSLDTSTLATTLTNNFDGAADTFLQSGSFGQNFNTVLLGIGNSGTGTIALALGNNSSAESNLAANKTALEARLTAYSTQLTTELNLANQTLQGIPEQLDEVNQMFYSISGYKSS